MTTTRTPQEAKEEVRNAIDIAQVIGERVPLRRAGRTWKGLCPFHAEKTPSFTVNAERQIWHCFGCNKGGDVFAFLMEIDKVTFPEALQALAERAGIDLPRAEATAGDKHRDRLYQATSLAKDFFEANLHSETGAHARQYLAGRGFDRPMLERFHIGYAPAGWDGLKTALGKLLPVEVLEEAGLVVRRGDGGHYDRFRNRITFPIEVGSGRLAGFGARAVDPEDTPKYLNSPESPIYRKGSVLFGLTLARTAIREKRQVLVCEGNLDVVRLHAMGFAHSVCTSGTALTIDQARALARFDAAAILVYDGDDAGIRAADRALEPMLASGLQVTILLLPEGEDPDSYLLQHGAQAFAGLIEGAMDPAAFLATARLSAPGANPTQEARVKRYVELLGRVEDPVRRRLMVRRGAVAFGLEESVLLEALGRKKGVGRRPVGSRAASPMPAAPPGGEPAGLPMPRSEATEAPEVIDPIERELAARCLTEDGAVIEVAQSGGVSCFRSKNLRALLSDWLTMGRAPLPEELKALESLDGFARSLLAEHPVDDGASDEAARKVARELLRRLEERRIKASLAELDRAIRLAERSREGDLDRLVAERRDLASKLHSGNSFEDQRRNHPAAS
jgi:DNA primase